MTDKKCKYLDLPDSAPQWHKDAHAAGHAGVECMVWDYNKNDSRKKSILHYKNDARFKYLDVKGDGWVNAEPIEEPECETIKVAIQPYIGESSGKQLVAVNEEIDEAHYYDDEHYGWNGPEQVIKIKVYKR